MVFELKDKMKTEFIELMRRTLIGTDEFEKIGKLMTDAPYILGMSTAMRDEIPRILIGQMFGYRFMIPIPDKH